MTGRNLFRAVSDQALVFLAHVVHELPFRFSLALGRGLGRLIGRCDRRHFQRVLRDMTLALGDRYSPEQLNHLALENYAHLGEGLIEFLRLPYMTLDEVRAWTVLERTDIIDEALAAGKGAIVITGHVGNWELAGVTVSVHGYPLTAIAREQRDDGVTRLLNQAREAHVMKIIPMSDVRGCLRILRNNGCLGVVTDTNANQPGAFVNFFGRPAATFAGVAFFALATSAPILPIFDERLPNGTHVSRFRDPIPVSRTGNRQRDLLITTMRVHRVIEAEVRRRPSEWFWLNQRWKTRPEEVPNPDRIPMEHRDLTPEEVADALAPLKMG